MIRPRKIVRRTDQANISRENEMVLIGADGEHLELDIWIAASGATSHMVFHTMGLPDCSRLTLA
jgi:hypothetical protein